MPVPVLLLNYQRNLIRLYLWFPHTFIREIYFTILNTIGHIVAWALVQRYSLYSSLYFVSFHRRSYIAKLRGQRVEKRFQNSNLTRILINACSSICGGNRAFDVSSNLPKIKGHKKGMRLNAKFFFYFFSPSLSFIFDPFSYLVLVRRVSFQCKKRKKGKKEREKTTRKKIGR